MFSCFKIFWRYNHTIGILLCYVCLICLYFCYWLTPAQVPGVHLFKAFNSNTFYEHATISVSILLLLSIYFLSSYFVVVVENNGLKMFWTYNSTCSLGISLEDIPNSEFLSYKLCIELRFNPWVGKAPWRRELILTPVFLPGEFHGQRGLASYSSWCLQRVGHNWATNTNNKKLFSILILQFCYSMRMDVNLPLHSYCHLTQFKNLCHTDGYELLYSLFLKHLLKTLTILYWRILLFLYFRRSFEINIEYQVFPSYIHSK